MTSTVVPICKVRARKQVTDREHLSRCLGALSTPICSPLITYFPRRTLTADLSDNRSTSITHLPVTLPRNISTIKHTSFISPATLLRSLIYCPYLHVPPVRCASCLCDMFQSRPVHCRLWCSNTARFGSAQATVTLPPRAIDPHVIHHY